MKENKMKSRLRLLVVPLAVAVLAACSTTGDQKPAPITESGNARPPVAEPPPPTTSTGNIGNVNVSPETGDLLPFKDFSVYFDLDKFEVSEQYIPLVRSHAGYLAKNPNQRASIQGNTDERGSREYNLSLGQKRAEAVKRMLVGFGVREAQVEAVSFGEEKPKAPGRDESAWSQNRRSDITYPTK
jgi:peptidoglycan-associated lipoprotein